MAEDKLDLSGEPKSLVESLGRHADDLSQAHHGHEGPIETVRETTYRNHHIVIRTTYSITVDDVAVEGHLGVSSDGQVHYHAIPNLGFSSALDLVKKVIDTFPEDFGDSYDDDGGDGEPANGDGGHDHEHGEDDGGHEHGEGEHEHGEGEHEHEHGEGEHEHEHGEGGHEHGRGPS
jgi:hypothetical protein